MNREPMTIAGYEKLQDRLKRLIEIERPQNVKDIAEARAHGDLSENAEYHAAKDKQGLLEAEINYINDRIARAHVIEPSSIKEEKVVFGATVTVLDLNSDRQIIYQIVGEDEADFKSGKISVKSPIARALFGNYEGDEVVVRTPKGKRYLEIETIEYK